MKNKIKTLKPLVSVVLPVFNADLYLEDAIDSILKQEYENFELIIVDDGSTDNSRKILESYTDSRIKLLLSSQNLGIVPSLSRGLEAASGEFIARMDADDISLPERLGLQINRMINDQLDICGCHWNSMDSSGKIISLLKAPLNSDYLIAILALTVPYAHGSVVFRRAFFEKNLLSYNPNTSCEDYKLWIDFFCKGGKFGAVDKVLYLHRTHANTITSRLNAYQLRSVKALRRYFVLSNSSKCRGAFQALYKDFKKHSDTEKLNITYLGFSNWRINSSELRWLKLFIALPIFMKLKFLYKIFNA